MRRCCFFWEKRHPAQYRSSEKIKPQWLHKLPKPSNSSFMYETVSASASSLDNAREKCLAELIANSGLKNGVVAISDNKSSERLSQIWNNGKLTERVEYDSHTSTHAQYDAIKLHVENIAEYWERDRSGNYYLTKLYAKSELGKAPLFDNIELTTRYGARGLWRSAIIPGWGQFHKGANLKGGPDPRGVCGISGRNRLYRKPAFGLCPENSPNTQYKSHKNLFDQSRPFRYCTQYLHRSRRRTLRL